MSSVKKGFVPVSERLRIVLKNLEDAKAENIVSIDIQGKSSLADYMVIASMDSQRHISAVADRLLSVLKSEGFGKARVEGLSGSDWVLIDIGDIIVHLFRPEARVFYDLETMWISPEGENTKPSLIEEG